MLDLAERVADVPFWWHSIDLGDGVVTPGFKDPELLEREWTQLQLPDLKGKSVLDIGTWDGWFAFRAERAGAERVVALDHFVWQERPRGRDGFNLAHSTLGSSVEAIEADFMTMDLSSLGTFDVVLFLGVLYHLRDPLGALGRLRQITSGTALVESEAAIFGGMEDLSACQFFETDECAGDPTNWWAPTAPALLGMCRAAGFANVTLLLGPPPVDVLAGTLLRYRATARADVSRS
jgi:tRNA (mo5U34)-methyltransferase